MTNDIDLMSYEEVEKLQDREMTKKWLINRISKIPYCGVSRRAIADFYDKIKNFNDLEVNREWVNQFQGTRAFKYNIRTKDFELTIRDGMFFITFFNRKKGKGSLQGVYPVMKKVSPIAKIMGNSNPTYYPLDELIREWELKLKIDGTPREIPAEWEKFEYSQLLQKRLQHIK